MNKVIKLYKRNKFVVILCEFMPTVSWWNLLIAKFKCKGHGFSEVEMCIIYFEDAVFESVYDFILKSKWYENGKTME